MDAVAVVAHQGLTTELKEYAAVFHVVWKKIFESKTWESRPSAAQWRGKLPDGQKKESGSLSFAKSIG
jgi:hypothetical protein